MNWIKACQLVALVWLCGFELHAQTCRLQVSGLNRNRIGYGPFDQECSWPHSVPFGNWGVASNYGPKIDGYQFQGWCRGDYVCYNDGDCGVRCNGNWYEWNSCTVDWRYSPPNCSLYNYNNCWAQQTDRPEGVHGVKTVQIAVDCPRDTNLDGICDEGGCKEVWSYGEATNYMTLYELDRWDDDEFIRTMYFPATSVNLTCDVGWCQAAGSPWGSPTSYDPPWQVKVFAEMAMIVDYGIYEDSVNCEYLRFGNPQYNCIW